ncbi:MAG: hypothetical protein HFG58_00605 [Lachnospiraceae bacterium]|nr:hypothetical protein [Lachnospiraceae bacterium]
MNSYEMIAVAQKLIQYLQPALSRQDIRLGMTNLKGSMIASTCKSYVGKFCEPALQAITQKQTIEVSPDNRASFFLSQEGSYVPVFHGRTLIGALALEGSLSRTKPLEEMCRLTAEAFFETEFYKEAYWGKLDQRNIFTKILLYCEEDPFPSEVDYITEKFKIDTSMIRIPVLFILRHNELSEEKLITEFKKNPLHESQDIICITRGQNAVVFKSLSKEPQKAVSMYRETVDAYIRHAQHLNINNGSPFLCMAGSLQSNLLSYHRAFRHTLWVCNHCVDVREKQETRVYFFYDFVFEYIQSQIDMDESTMIFSVFAEILSNREWDSFSRILGTLLKNNMNISSSAKDLYLHRNTLINWLNRYRQLFGVDPVNDSAGFNFTQQLHYFYTHSLMPGSF